MTKMTKAEFRKLQDALTKAAEGKPLRAVAKDAGVSVAQVLRLIVPANVRVDRDAVTKLAGSLGVDLGKFKIAGMDKEEANGGEDA